MGVVLLGLGPGGPIPLSSQGRSRAPETRPGAISSAAPTPLRTLPLVGSALAVDEAAGRVFVAGGGEGAGFVATLDAGTGRVLRMVAVGTLPVALAVDPVTARVFVASATGQSMATLDARSGALLHTIRTTGMPTAIAVDALSGRVFVTSRLTSPSAPGFVTVLDARRGCVLGVVRVGPEPDAVATDALVGHAFVASGVGSDSRVSILEAHHGRVLRSVYVGDLPVAVAVDAATARVFVAANGDGSVSMLNATNGAILRTISGLGAVDFMVAAQHVNRVFITLGGSGFDGSIKVLDARSGALLHTVVLGDLAHRQPNSPAALPVIDGQAGRVFMLLQSLTDQESGDPLGPGALAVLDARTGAVRRRVNLGDTVSASSGRTLGLALDTRTNRVFVLTTHSVRIYDAARLG